MSSEVYAALCQTAETFPHQQAIELATFLKPEAIAEKTFGERLAAALQVLLRMLEVYPQKQAKLNIAIIDYLISRLDEKMSKQVDSILHHPDFQDLEALWRATDYLVKQTDVNTNTKIMDL